MPYMLPFINGYKAGSLCRISIETRHSLSYLHIYSRSYKYLCCSQRITSKPTRQTNILLPSMSRVHNISHTHVPHTGSLVHIDPVQRAFPTPHTDSLAHIDPMTSFPDASFMYYVAQYEHERRYQYCHSKKVSMPSRNHLYDRCVRCSTKKI